MPVGVRLGCSRHERCTGTHHHGLFIVFPATSERAQCTGGPGLDAARPAPGGARDAERRGSASASPGPEILVVDDDEDLRSVVCEALLSQGYRVAEAGNGEDALSRVAEAEPQLVLLDMWMPIMDGWAFARALRERYGRKIPIVVMTAGESSRLRADEIGANADVGKPLELARLYEIVGDNLRAP